MPVLPRANACPNGHQFNFHLPSLVNNALRELAQREQVYPRLVAKGTMRQAEAEQLKAMQAQTIAVLSILSSVQSEFEEFLRQRGAAPAPPPHHDPRTEVIR